MILVYGVVKFLGYSAWCYLALWFAHRADASITSSLRLGAVRWCIGLVFGIAIAFFIGSIDAAAVARTYFLVYSPVRALEWGIMAVLVANRHEQSSRSITVLQLSLWCVGGMLVSFLTDLLSPEGVQGRFCVGRCLC